MRGSPPPRPFGFRLLVATAIIATLLVIGVLLSPRQLTGWDAAKGAPTAIIGILMLARLLAFRGQFGKHMQQAALWLAFAVVLVVGYSFKDELQPVLGRVSGAMVPGHGVEVAPGMMRFSAEDGHQFFVNADVNGVTIHFLVDTGASGIALSQHDAKRLGLDASDLKFTQQFSTANGMTRGAPVTLDRLKIGPFEATHVSASVNEGDLEESLLGMRFLSTLGRIEIKGDRLTIER
jgi:aspartyl protease family protein